MGVVGEAVLLFLGIVQHQAELHPLAGHLPQRQAAEPGEDLRQAAPRSLGQQLRPRLAAGGPVRRHLGEIVRQQRRRRLQIGRAPGAGAVSAMGEVIVRGRTFSRARAGAVQVLAPEQEFDGMVAGRDVGLHALRLLQPAQQGRIDGRGVDIPGADADAGLGDEVQGVERIEIRLGPVGRRDVVDQALVHGPGVHPRLPGVDHGVAETESLALQIGYPRRPPRGAGGVQGPRRRMGQQPVDGGLQRPRAGQGVAVDRLGHVRVVGDHRLRRRRGLPRRRPRAHQRQDHGAGQAETTPPTQPHHHLRLRRRISRA